ncbi:MAG TPA: hypothetical protein VGK25_10810 [Ignavibacteria bacterium]|jgi:hypothetical protein
MILKRLVEILKTFDKAELKKFERFVRSDYFNTNVSVLKLIKGLKKFYPNFDNHSINKEKLFTFVYEKRKYDDKTFRYLLSELLELTEKFLRMSYIEKNPFDERRILIEELFNRRLFSHAEKYLKILDLAFDEKPFFSLTLINHKLESATLWHHLKLSTDIQEPLIDKRSQMADYLIFYCLIESANLIHNIIGLERHYNVKFNSDVIQAFNRSLDYKLLLERLDKQENKIQLPKNKKLILEAVKFHICYMITILDIKEEKYFYRMKDIVNRYGDFFSREDLFNIYSLLGACCTLKMEASDNDKYYKEHFEIDKACLEKGLLTHDEEQYMQVNGFIGLLHMATALRELDWMEKFIEQYIEKISPELRDDAYNYSIANLYFERGDYNMALELINKVKYKYFHFKEYVRALTLRIYYELNYFEQAFSLIDSFTHFLNTNNRIDPEMKLKSLNFINFTKNLLKLKTGTGIRIKPNVLENEILHATVNDKNWLLKKVKELGVMK